MKPNDIVYFSNNNTKAVESLTLSDKLSKEGEENVFLIKETPSLCVKIYHNQLTQHALEKLKLMTANKFRSSFQAFQKKGICWPLAVIYSDHKQKQPIGYMMPKAAEGVINARNLFHPLERKRNYSDITRTDMCLFLENWLTALKLLQDNKCLVGDINETNVLVDLANMTPYIVDCDRFQIGTYPCPVGTPDFLAPELQGVKLKDTLRTEEHENFAIAVFIFKALVGGVNPFAVKGGGTVEENIRQGLFPYPYGEIYTPEITPAGKAEECWKLISMELKELFYKTFVRKNRATSSEWHKQITIYHREIESGKHSDSLDNLNLSTKVDTKRNTTQLDDARIKKSKGEALNYINKDHSLGTFIGILELSTRAVKAMKVNVIELWDGFRWKKPYFENEAQLTHTGQLINHDKEMNLEAFNRTILPVIESFYKNLKDSGCSHIYGIATAAYRSAKNNDKILTLLKRKNINVMILTRDQEADYTNQAFRWTQTKSKLYGDCDILLVDQGGGSTEITLLDSQNQLLGSGNVPLGTEAAVNSIYTNFSGDTAFDIALVDAPKSLRRTMNTNTLKLTKIIQERKRKTILIALGTAITAATEKRGNAKQHNTKITRENLESFINKKQERLQNQSTILHVAGLHNYIDKVKGERSNKKRNNYYDDLIHYLGCVMYMHLLTRFNFSDLIVCGAGLRYGVAINALNQLSIQNFGQPFGQGEFPKILVEKRKELNKPKEYNGIIEGEIRTGMIINIRDFGIFVRLKDGIDGLIHKSNYPQAFDPSFYGWGEELDVKIKSISADMKNPNKMKIELVPIV